MINDYIYVFIRMNEAFSQLYYYERYILTNPVSFKTDKSRLTDKSLYIKHMSTFQHLRTGKKKEEIRCLFPSVIGPLPLFQKRYNGVCKDMRIGDIIRVRHKKRVLYMFIYGMKIYKDTDIRKVLEEKDYKKIVPDAENIEQAIERYTNDCYKKKLTIYNKFYYIIKIELLPIFYL